MIKVGDEVLLIYKGPVGNRFLDNYYVHSIDEEEDTIRCHILPSKSIKRSSITVHNYSTSESCSVIPKNTKNKARMLLGMSVFSYMGEEVELYYQ